jgi:site-specific DNA recombinase
MTDQIPAGADSLIYARVSTEEQARKNFSIPHQLERCREYATRAGFIVAAELSDDETGAHLERTNLERLRDMIRTRAIKRVIVWRQDRIARDELGYFTLRAEFKRYNVELHVVTRGGKAEGLYANLEAVLDADERGRIAERTSRGRADKARRGKIVGNGPPPFGYIRQGDREAITWAIDDQAADTVRRIFHLYVVEQLSLSAVAAQLTAEGRPTPSDRRPEVRRKRGPGLWNRETVRWTLANPTYTGVFYAYRHQQPRGDTPKKRPTPTIRPASEWVPIPVPQIVDPDLYTKAQQRLASAPALSFRNTKRHYLVARHIRCSCGRGATASTSSLTGYNRQQYSYYSCNSRRRGKADKHAGPPCDVPPFRADAVDALVWAWIENDILNPPALRRGLNAYDAKRAEAQQPADPTAERRNRRDQLLEQRDRLNRAYLAGAMDFTTEYQPLKADLDRQLAEIERLLLDANSQPTTTKSSRAEALLMVETIVEEYGEEIHHAEKDDRRFFVDRLEIVITMLLRDGEKWLRLRSNALDYEVEKPLST